MSGDRSECECGRVRMKEEEEEEEEEERSEFDLMITLCDENECIARVNKLTVGERADIFALMSVYR